MHISCIIFAPFVGAYFYLLTYCVSVNAFFDAVDLYECFRYKFSQNDGRRRIFSFYRKIYKADRKSTRLNSSHYQQSRMPSSA